MNKKSILTLSLLAGSAIFLAGCTTENTPEIESETGIANPASAYCEENGGILEIVSDESGDRGKCIFENGNWCEEWDFYNGECSEEISIQEADSNSDGSSNKENRKLMAFNGKEVEGNYNMTIDENGQMGATFCNSMGGIVIFDGDDISGTITTVDGIARTEMRCEGESMEIEDAFNIEGAEYSILESEDGTVTMLLNTVDGNKYAFVRLDFDTNELY